MNPTWLQCKQPPRKKETSCTRVHGLEIGNGRVMHFQGVRSSGWPGNLIQSVVVCLDCCDWQLLFHTIPFYSVAMRALGLSSAPSRIRKIILLSAHWVVGDESKEEEISYEIKLRRQHVGRSFDKPRLAVSMALTELGVRFPGYWTWTTQWRRTLPLISQPTRAFRPAPGLLEMP